MAYSDVLKHLKGVVIDRVILSDLSTAWESNGTVTVTVDTEYNTVHTNTMKLEDMAENDYVYCQQTNPLRLDDREYIRLYLYSTGTIAEDSLTIVLSDSQTLLTPTATLEVPAITAGMNIIDVEITTPKDLSNIQSAGLKALTTVTPTIYISLFNATATEYLTTIEEIESKETDGTGFVTSKLDPGSDTVPDELTEAVYLAAAGLFWMKDKENEQFQNDYGGTTSKNYGKYLLGRAETMVEEYLAGGDVETEDGTGPSPINTDIYGGSDVEY